MEPQRAGVVAAAAVAVLLWLVKDALRADAFAAQPRVVILMFSTPNILEYAKYSARVNAAYARRHGYDFRHVVGPSPHPTPAWYKVRLLREALDTHDVAFFIDSDAVFNRMHESLDGFLAHDADLMGCTDSPNGPYHINCGTLLARSTPWAKGFLDAWWGLRDEPKYNKWAFEQQALHDLIDADAHGCQAHAKVKVFPVDAFNSNISDLLGHANGARQAFVMHFMSTGADVRKRELKAVCAREKV